MIRDRDRMKMQEYVGSKLQDPVLLCVFVIVAEDGFPYLRIFYLFQNIHLLIIQPQNCTGLWLCYCYFYPGKKKYNAEQYSKNRIVDLCCSK